MMAPIEEQSTTPVLTVADVNDLPSEKGKEIATVCKFNLTWVRAALAALDIAVDDKSYLGECKAAHSAYYMNLVGGSAAKSTAKDDAFFRVIRARSVLLKNAPSPQKVPGLHWKALGCSVCSICLRIFAR